MTTNPFVVGAVVRVPSGHFAIGRSMGRQFNHRKGEPR